MKNIDNCGHTILYPAALSGTPKVLNLIMEQDWWKDVLDQEKKTGRFEDFAYNVCSAGCICLAKLILEQDCSMEFLAKSLIR
jgi:hypothetical protein